MTNPPSDRRYTGTRDELAQSIIKVVGEYGPLTRGEVCDMLGRHRNNCASVISRLAKPQKTLSKRLYIYDYVYEDDVSSKRFPRARYMLGDKPDAKKPKANPALNRKRWRERQKGRVASVFDLALTRRERDAKRKQTLGTGSPNRRRPLQEVEDSADGIQYG